ncbi:MAG: winged helix DNA-binding protein [Alphaproteobacteria bacterium]|nr:winged helix DNA-binding protein [Alphaproteobacteria bacterium]
MPAAQDSANPDLRNEYLDLTRLVERLHRRFLDVIRAELSRMNVRDLNSVQALLLTNIGNERIAIRELIERGYYQGSNVSYNIKKLVDMGYLEHERSAHDRRSVNVNLTAKAQAVVAAVRNVESRSAEALARCGIEEDGVKKVCESLRRVEVIWTDLIERGKE